VDDFVADIDRRAILFQRLLDDLDRAYDTRTEAARLGKDDFDPTKRTMHDAQPRKPEAARQRARSLQHAL
jgi:hypothetical protein